MNKETGAIAQFENDDDARKAGFTRKLTPELASVLLPLSRPKRKVALRIIEREEQGQRKAKRRAQRQARRANR